MDVIATLLVAPSFIPQCLVHGQGTALWIHPPTHVYMHAHPCVGVYMGHTHVDTHNLSTQHSRTKGPKSTHACRCPHLLATHTHAHPHTHMHVHTCTHIHMHTHNMHTHTPYKLTHTCTHSHLNTWGSEGSQGTVDVEGGPPSLTTSAPKGISQGRASFAHSLPTFWGHLSQWCSTLSYRSCSSLPTWKPLQPHPHLSSNRLAAPLPTASELWLHLLTQCKPRTVRAGPRRPHMCTNLWSVNK